jgi:nucleoside permease NupC
MAVSALFPILLVVPLFDILMYFNILPKVIGGIGSLSQHVQNQSPKKYHSLTIVLLFSPKESTLKTMLQKAYSMEIYCYFSINKFILSMVFNVLSLGENSST